MLNTDDIKDLVSGEEGDNVDFKRNVPSKVRELTEEVCSFLNAAGGYLLLGVPAPPAPAPPSPRPLHRAATPPALRPTQVILERHLSTNLTR